MSHLELVALIVREYDPAIDFFVNVLEFDLIEDVPAETNDGRPKRWVVVRPPGATTGILLARADGGRQTLVAGDQFAGRVGFFLRVDDFDATHARMVSAGVRFVSPRRVEAYGQVAVFLDLEGNRWDLLGPAPAPHIPEIFLRPAVLDDAPAIGDVFDAAVRVGWTYMGDIVREPMFPPEEWLQTVADHVAPNAMVVAVDGRGTIVGFTAVRPSECEMFLLFVHPDVAGTGVGRTLLAAADDMLREAGCRTAFLFTHEQNARALATYAAAGYRPDGTVRESIFRDILLRELRLVKQL